MNNMVFIGFGAINWGAKNNAEQKGVIEEYAVCTQNTNNTRKGAERGGCAMKFALIAALGVKPEFASPARSAGSEFFCCLSHSRCALSCYNLTDIPGMFGGVAVRGPQDWPAGAD